MCVIHDHFVTVVTAPSMFLNMHIAHCNHSCDKSIGTLEPHMLNATRITMRRTNPGQYFHSLWVIAVCNVQSGLKIVKQLYPSEIVSMVSK